MSELTFLRVNIGGRTYLFEEKIVAKVTSGDNLPLFSSPYGKNIPFLTIYNNCLIPIFSISDKLYLKESLILILIKMLDIAGIFINNFIDFVKITKDDLNNSIVVDEYYSKRALKIGGMDCYFFDEMPLFSGEESI